MMDAYSIDGAQWSECQMIKIIIKPGRFKQFKIIYIYIDVSCRRRLQQLPLSLFKNYSSAGTVVMEAGRRWFQSAIVHGKDKGLGGGHVPGAVVFLGIRFER